MVSAQATRRARARTAPRPHRNAVVLGPLDEVGHDQEVAGKAHLVDDRSRNRAGRNRPAAPPLPSRHRVRAAVPARHGHRDPHHAPRPPCRRQGSAGSACAWAGQGAALGDDQGVGGRLGQVGEQLGHHRRGLDPGLAAGARPVRRVDVGGIGDAQHRIVRAVETRFGKACRDWSRPAAGREHRRARSARPRRSLLGSLRCGGQSRCRAGPGNSACSFSQ
jgi:hypothetical protein